ncbi:MULTISPECIES: hypothetical protein [Parafrankia]|nr:MULTISPECIES: hypothetical protein [Parafrankia]MBE3205129.1 hypothetical protein [Parafrankia sp. CH37]
MPPRCRRPPARAKRAKPSKRAKPGKPAKRAKPSKPAKPLDEPGKRVELAGCRRSSAAGR